MQPLLHHVAGRTDTGALAGVREGVPLDTGGMAGRLRRRGS